MLSYQDLSRPTSDIGTATEAGDGRSAEVKKLEEKENIDSESQHGHSVSVCKVCIVHVIFCTSPGQVGEEKCESCPIKPSRGGDGGTR